MKIVITENQLKNLIKKDIMVEGKQVGILYHTTSNKRLFKIIQENKLNAFSNDFNNSIDYRNKLGRDLKVTFAGPILTNKEKYPPYISFTRNKNYKRASTDSVLVIDGDKLSERYKIRPYSHLGGRNYDEMEERIYRDVVDLDKYIIKVILPNENEELELLLNEKGITYEINDIKNIMSKEMREQEQTEVELTEKCWKGYTQKGMKTMFGKRYPNCVKKTK